MSGNSHLDKINEPKPSVDREAIRMECEGSGTPALHHLCTMCGKPGLIYNGIIIPHLRDDILAMIDRGDFDD